MDRHLPLPILPVGRPEAEAGVVLTAGGQVGVPCASRSIGTALNWPSKAALLVASAHAGRTTIALKPSLVCPISQT
jgi:hypothetical protein